MKKKVVIIGGGLGGLFTGAILSKEGLHVTVLEKNATIGGGLQSFKRFGETFDTGMHVIGGMQTGGNIRKICNYLGILDQVKLMDVDDECTDRLYFAEDHECYTIAKGRRGFVDSLAASFPEERENLEMYVEAIFDLTAHVDLFNLRPSEGAMSLFSGSSDFLMSANDFIAKYTDNRKLRSVLAYMNPMYGGRAHQTPAYIHAIISTLYINGASRFVDGSYHFADLLVQVITSHGGYVITNEEVEWIEVNNRVVDYVQTKRGERYQADFYISDIHPCTMLQLMDEKAMPKSYRERLNSIPNSHSAFSLYIKLKENSFPYINYSEYYMTRYDDVWNFSNPEKPWPLGFLFMTPPNHQQGQYATKVLVTAPMPFEMVKKWEHTVVGHRGEDYEEWKKEKTEALLRQIEDIHSGFKDCIADINASSPLTIRDYYHVKEGSICGFSKDCQHIALSQVPVVTKVSNLFLTGQNNNMHGFCGVPLTAINTCEAILGINHVINKINECDRG
ncbi:MAG: NAD(P)/FAD-dependent oxidoreductase [Prevotellaceae bacterium]|nr:NAD(P)/FAD-dependent oxidoreductase [Prevotellaceae bacterium]